MVASCFKAVCRADLGQAKPFKEPRDAIDRIDGRLKTPAGSQFLPDTSISEYTSTLERSFEAAPGRTGRGIALNSLAIQSAGWVLGRWTHNHPLAWADGELGGGKSTR
jgi:hypothetical protein